MFNNHRLVLSTGPPAQNSTHDNVTTLAKVASRQSRLSSPLLVLPDLSSLLFIFPDLSNLGFQALLPPLPGSTAENLFLFQLYLQKLLQALFVVSVTDAGIVF